MSFAVEMGNVTKAFDGYPVLKDTNFCVKQGSVHALIGPNGAGKSTLLRLMVNLLNPTRGEITVLGESVRDNPRLRQSVHYVAADTAIYSTFKVNQVLQYSRMMYESWDEGRCKKLMDSWDMPPHKRIAQLSFGMKMKLKLIIAFSAMPKVLLLDEVMTGIDPASKQQIADMLLQEVALRDVTVVTATHQIAEVEQIADTLSVMAKGTILCTHEIDQLRETIFELHAVLPPGLDVDLNPDLDVDHAGAEILVQTLREDRLSLCLVGDPIPVRRKLERVGARILDVSKASLDDWFQALLVKEGLTSGRISLFESTAL